MKNKTLLLEKSGFTQDKYLFVLAATALVAGVFFRFWDLGGAPLAVDEYFLGTSTLNTAKYGLPMFDCGGYYTRGILLQYLTLPLLALGASLEFAVRFWPAVAGILSIIAVWRIALLVGGTRTALIALLLTSLSLWEVEFARFGRMYAPFQAAFLWYAYFQIQHLVKGHESARWCYLAISALAVFIYEGAAMLVVLNFLALIWPGKRWNLAHLGVASGLLVATMKFFTTDFRRLLPTNDQLPPASGLNNVTSPADASVDVPLDLPSLPDSMLLIIIMGACVLGLAAWRYRRQIKLAHPAMIFWSLTLLCFSMGFVSFGIALALAGQFMKLPSPVQTTNLRAGSLFGWLATISSLWFAVLLVSFQNRGADFLSSVKDALRYMFDYPDVYYKIVFPWMQAIPFTTVFLTVLTAVAIRVTLKKLQNESPEARVAGYLFGAIILLFILVGLLPQPYATTRYTYFIYPVLIILASLGISTIAGTWGRAFKSDFVVVVALMIPLFVFAEDFRLIHLAKINEPEIRYRTDYSKTLANHYYQRWDFRSVAFHVNANLLANDNVIVFEQPLPHYLSRTAGYFAREGSNNHHLIQACRGKRDLWSNAPLLSQEADVQQVIDATKGQVWLIVRTDKYAHRDPLEWLLVERYELLPEFISQDGYLAVYRIDTSRKSAQELTGSRQIRL